MREEFERFRKRLKTLLPDVSVELDMPSDPMAESFLDICHDDYETTVSFRPDKGFGIYAGEGGYGDRPDAILREPESAAYFVAQMAMQHAAGERSAGITLRQMRQMLGVTQQEIAALMDVSQPAVAQIERSRSPGLGTLARHARSLGAEVQVVIVNKDMEVRLSHPSLQQTG